MNKTRLLNVAIALEDAAKNEELTAAFTMHKFVHNNSHEFCGTPACAIGHYAARRDLQDALAIYSETNALGTTYRVTAMDNFEAIPSWDDEDEDGDYITFDNEFNVAKHFEITGKQCEELFGYNGCNDAATPTEAATYIRKFVKVWS